MSVYHCRPPGLERFYGVVAFKVYILPARSSFLSACVCFSYAVSQSEGLLTCSRRQVRCERAPTRPRIKLYSSIQPLRASA